LSSYLLDTTLANILLQLATGDIPGVADRTQVLYSTHSPLFVGLDRFNSVRIVRKVPHGTGLPKITKLTHRTLSDVAQLLWAADGEPEMVYTGVTLKPRLATLLNPWMSEGFFSSVVVLVEGEDDRAALVGTARAMDRDLESASISVIPCFGKSNIHTAAAVFKAFGIPVYCVWDGDAHLGATSGACETCGRALDNRADPRENHRLLRLLGLEPVDWPEYCGPVSACFKSDLETTLRVEIGPERFSEILKGTMKLMSITKQKHAMKNPLVLATILQVARSSGKTSRTLEQIISNILELRRGGPSRSASAAGG